MKRIMTASICLLSGVGVYCQEPADALRFSWTTPAATARVAAIGGANASLGGDITSTFVNPAGLAFFRTGDFVLTPAVKFGNTNSQYLGSELKAKSNNLSWGTSGLVLGGGSNSKGSVRNVTFSLAVNRAANFNSRIQYRGRNNHSSFSQKFVEELSNNGVKTSSQAEFGYPLGASLAYNTHWIDSISNGAGQIAGFRTNAPVSTGLLQQNTISTEGGISEFALGLAVNLRDKLLLGGTLGVPVLNYKRNGEFVEADATTNPNNRFNYGVFSDILHTHGAGINLKAGLIYKPAELWRLGLSFHSPTFFTLTDNYEAKVVLNDDVPDNMAWQDNSKNYTGNQPSEFQYYLITPYRVIGSVSYVLREVQDVSKQRGFLTADMEYVNYAASSFQPDTENHNDQGTKDYLSALNRAIDKAYTSSFNFRVGGELKFTTVMVRAGLAYFGNPYKNIAGEKGSKFNISGGLGYRHKGFFVDLTYVHSLQKDVHFPYRLQYSNYPAANLKTTNHNAVVTFGFKI